MSKFEYIWEVGDKYWNAGNKQEPYTVLYPDEGCNAARIKDKPRGKKTKAKYKAAKLKWQQETFGIEVGDTVRRIGTDTEYVVGEIAGVWFRKDVGCSFCSWQEGYLKLVKKAKKPNPHVNPEVKVGDWFQLLEDHCTFYEYKAGMKFECGEVHDGVVRLKAGIGYGRGFSGCKYKLCDAPKKTVYRTENFELDTDTGILSYRDGPGSPRESHGYITYVCGHWAHEPPRDQCYYWKDHIEQIVSIMNDLELNRISNVG